MSNCLNGSSVVRCVCLSVMDKFLAQGAQLHHTKYFEQRAQIIHNCPVFFGGSERSACASGANIVAIILSIILSFGRSRVCAPVEPTKWSLVKAFFSLLFSLSGLFTYSPRRGCHRVLKF